MRKISLICLLLSILVSLTMTSYGQDAKIDTADTRTGAKAEVGRALRLEFVVKEIAEDGKVLNSRSFSTLCDSPPTQQIGCHIRTGSKVPYRGPDNNLQYLDLGVNIDVIAAHLVGNQLTANVAAEISRAGGPTTDEPHGAAVIRQNRWSSDVSVSLGHSVSLFSSDDLSSKGRLAVDMTASAVK